MTIGLPECTDDPYLYLVDDRDDPEDPVWVSFNGPAWAIVDCWKLVAPTWKVRGENEPPDGSPGRAPNPLRIDQTDYSLPGIIVGDCLPDGNPYGGTPSGGLASNLTTLGALLEPATPPQPGRTWELYVPDEVSPRSALAQVIGFQPGQVIDGYDWNGYHGLVMTFTLDLRVPDGRFA